MRVPPVLLALTAALGAACGSTPAGVGDDDGDLDADPSAPPDAAPPPDAPTAFRFVAMGDTGEGNDDQYAVGAQVAALCEREGCDAVFLLGDNIYDSGVASVDDDQWDTKFELPYADVDAPFYAVLGNHDYGGELIFDVPGLGNEWDKGPIEVEYSAVSTKWNMPDTFYTLRFGPIGFVALDTNSVLWSDTRHGDQAAWWPEVEAEMADAAWVFVLGHHPYRSNGTHGNAGNYEAPEIAGLEIPNPLPIVNGGAMQDFYEDVVCGTADVLITGHDHSRQWLDEPEALCGAELIVSGAGAKVTAIRDRGNAARYEDASEAGFLYVVVEGTTMTGQFYDRDGNLDFEHTVER